MSGLEISYLAAIGAGIVSFLSPCVLPLVPAYLSFIAGSSFEELTAKDGRQAPMARVVVAAGAFIAGFAIVFMILGASASTLHHLLFQHLDIIVRVAGLVIIVLGLNIMGVFRIGLLAREARFQTAAGGSPFAAFVAGLAFAFGWTPCIGPILATILTVAARHDSIGQGVTLLGLYALGLGVPFLAAALAIRPFMAFVARFRRHIRTVEIATGAMVTFTGVLIFFDAFSQIGFWLLEALPFLANLG
jgi:cytochrome c-type biogenesis protein